ncbi:hypothetical protein BDF20DRAFT_814878 [Mycotypha africana]|uniref:uncharacterized protein n=1 Tax=Mycotypha africana TaxID=64632 RepID=UPI0022FFCAB4|nr:uncharacterized protein BDF20DRAFT_814878 [Mycotypha africana]KAI8987870.1 hypothetical protein BDF20DRAFT_814878 [Mycotypha africana]
MCFHCKRELKEGEAFKTYKNRIYCHDDFVQLFAPKCRSCHQPVENEAVSAMDGKLEGKWHMACFNCQICHEPFPDNTFYVFDHQPYCKKHYHLLNNSLCSRCHEGIENLCALTAEGWRFHPSCFTCEVCQQRLGDTYYVFENRIYCEEHIQRQLGKNNQNNSHSNNSQLLDKRRTQIYNMQSNKA